MEKLTNTSLMDRSFLALIKDVLPAGIAYVFLFTSVGYYAYREGFDLIDTMLMSVLIYASPLQIIMIEGASHQTALISVVLLTVAVNYRFLVMSSLLFDQVHYRNRILMIPLMAMLSASSFVIMWDKIRTSHGKIDIHYALIISIILYITSIIFTLIGYLFISDVNLEIQQTILFVLPLYFTIAMAKRFTDFKALILVVMGFLLTPVGMKYFGLYSFLIMPLTLTLLVVSVKYVHERCFA